MTVLGVPVPKPVGNTSRRNKRRAYSMEVDLASRLKQAGDRGAYRVPLSGALKGVGLDGDVSSLSAVLECKSLTPLEVNGIKYFRFSVPVLDKVMAEAKLHGKFGFVVVQPKGGHRAFVFADRDQLVELLGDYARLKSGGSYVQLPLPETDHA